MVKINGGNRFSEALKELARKLSGKPKLQVGFLENATYPNGKRVALIAAFNEFGTRTSPPRPFFRRMVAAKSGEWPTAMAGLLRANDYDADKVLRLSGEAIKGQLQQSIRDLTSPALAPSTVARKGFAKPLIETGHMLNSVDYRVVK